MTPEQVLLSLYGLRKETEAKAIQNYEMGIGVPYTDELRKIDEQIAEISKRTTLSPELLPTQNLSPANRKKLCILEKLKEEWDIYPNKNRYTISQKKYWNWINEFGIDDFPQFQNFLLALKRDGLIIKFEFMPDYI